MIIIYEHAQCLAEAESEAQEGKELHVHRYRNLKKH